MFECRLKELLGLIPPRSGTFNSYGSVARKEEPLCELYVTHTAARTKELVPHGSYTLGVCFTATQ